MKSKLEEELALLVAEHGWKVVLGVLAEISQEHEKKLGGFGQMASAQGLLTVKLLLAKAVA